MFMTDSLCPIRISAGGVEKTSFGLIAGIRLLVGLVHVKRLPVPDNIYRSDCINYVKVFKEFVGLGIKEQNSTPGPDLSTC